MRLTLLTRAYCHLCDEMRDALAGVAGAAGFEVVEIDVDAHPALEERFGERVPVLLRGDPAGGTEICHYRLDDAKLRAALGLVAGEGDFR